MGVWANIPGSAFDADMKRAQMELAYRQHAQDRMRLDENRRQFDERMALDREKMASASDAELARMYEQGRQFDETNALGERKRLDNYELTSREIARKELDDMRSPMSKSTETETDRNVKLRNQLLKERELDEKIHGRDLDLAYKYRALDDKKDIASANDRTRREIAQGNNASNMAIAELRDKGSREIAEGNNASNMAIAELRDKGSREIAEGNNASNMAIAKLRNKGSREIAKENNDTRMAIAKLEDKRSREISSNNLAQSMEIFTANLGLKRDALEWDKVKFDKSQINAMDMFLMKLGHEDNINQEKLDLEYTKLLETLGFKKEELKQNDIHFNKTQLQGLEALRLRIDAEMKRFEETREDERPERESRVSLNEANTELIKKRTGLVPLQQKLTESQIRKSDKDADLLGVKIEREEIAREKDKKYLDEYSQVIRAAQENRKMKQLNGQDNISALIAIGLKDGIVPPEALGLATRNIGMENAEFSQAYMDSKGNFHIQVAGRDNNNNIVKNEEVFDPFKILHSMMSCPWRYNAESFDKVYSGIVRTGVRSEREIENFLGMPVDQFREGLVWSNSLYESDGTKKPISELLTSKKYNSDFTGLKEEEIRGRINASKLKEIETKASSLEKAADALETLAYDPNTSKKDSDLYLKQASEKRKQASDIRGSVDSSSDSGRMIFEDGKNFKIMDEDTMAIKGFSSPMIRNSWYSINKGQYKGYDIMWKGGDPDKKGNVVIRRSNTLTDYRNGKDR